MADDDELVVQIAGDDASTGNGAGTEAAVAEVDAQFKQLQADVARANEEKAQLARRAADAETAAQQAARERDTVAKELTSTRASTVDDGIASATQAIDAAKKEIKTAGEAGDYGAQADAYDRLADARSRLNRLNEAKADLDVQRAEPVRGRVEAPRQEPVQQRVTDDPVERAVAGMDTRDATWLRQHPEYITDQKKNAKIRAAHFDAMSELGESAVHTPAYYEHLETYVGLRSDAAPQNGNGRVEVVVNGNGAAPAKPVIKPASRRAPVAPVQSSGSAIGNGGGGTVRLSQKQADAATDGTHVWNYDDPSPQKRFKKGEPIGIQEMARRVKSMTEQGLFRPENAEIS